MEYLKEFFKRAVSKYVDVVRDDMISFGYDQGMEIRDLRLNTQVINDVFKASDMEARLEFGRIGRMNLVYTPLPGIVTIQIKDLDIRVRPNFTGLALRKLVETIQELGDLDNGDFFPGGVPTVSCGSCPPSNCGFEHVPEIHNTQARLVHPCRIPRAPPIVRRARFVTALPAAPAHFKQPVRGACEGFQNCVTGLTRSPDACLDKLCDEFSMLSNSLISTCGATNEKVVGGCEEIKNMLSNCMESVAGRIPPAYDELGRIKLPTLRVGPVDCCKEYPAWNQNRQRVLGIEIPTPLPSQRAQAPYPSEEGLQPVMAFSHNPIPVQRHGVIIRPVVQRNGEAQPSSWAPQEASSDFSQPMATPTAQYTNQNQGTPGARLLPPSHTSYAPMSHMYYQQANPYNPYPYASTTGMSALPDSAFQGNGWQHNATISSYSPLPVQQTMHTHNQPYVTAATDYPGNCGLSPVANQSSQQVEAPMQYGNKSEARN